MAAELAGFFTENTYLCLLRTGAGGRVRSSNLSMLTMKKLLILMAFSFIGLFSCKGHNDLSVEDLRRRCNRIAAFWTSGRPMNLPQGIFAAL